LNEKTDVKFGKGTCADFNGPAGAFLFFDDVQLFWVFDRGKMAIGVACGVIAECEPPIGVTAGVPTD
jgi:hypothetical protein